MKWFDYLIFSILLILGAVWVCNINSRCTQLESDILTLRTLNHELIQRNEQLMRVNEQTLVILAQGGWESWQP